MSIWVQKIIIIIVVNIMECLSCARQGSKYFTQFWSLQTSYNIGNIIAVFEMMELRPRRVKQQSWSHRGRKGQNSDSTQGVWPRTCAMLQSPPHSCLSDGCSFIHSRILHTFSGAWCMLYEVHKVHSACPADTGHQFLPEFPTCWPTL